MRDASYKVCVLPCLCFVSVIHSSLIENEAFPRCRPPHERPRSSSRTRMAYLSCHSGHASAPSSSSDQVLRSLHEPRKSFLGRHGTETLKPCHQYTLFTTTSPKPGKSVMRRPVGFRRRRERSKVFNINTANQIDQYCY